MINQNCKTSCGLIQGGWSPAGSSDLFSILGCMNSSNLVLVLFHFVFYCSCLRRTDTIVFAQLNNPPSLKSPPPSSNAFEINTCNPPGGGGTVLAYRYCSSSPCQSTFLTQLCVHCSRGVSV